MSLRILLVDDDPAVLRFVAKQLTNAGHTVFTAGNGVEALQQLRQESASIVITDWMMPEMDGLELCRAIREFRDSGLGFIYVIILTAQSVDDHIVEAFDAGVDDYVTKPVNLKELFARLRAGQRIIELQKELEKRSLEIQRVNAQLGAYSQELGEANHKLNILATRDELTGLTNRREAIRLLDQAWNTAKRHDDPCSCIILDIDHFKSVNDTYGHDVGDQVLKSVAATLDAATRTDEPLARIGGEEFLVLCPRAVLDEATAAAERLRRAVEESPVGCGQASLPITISLGAAARTPDMQNYDTLLKAADDALYAAKRTGRNRTCRADQIADSTDAGPASDSADAPQTLEPFEPTTAS